MTAELKSRATGPVNAGELEERRSKKRNEMFDQICQKFSLTPTAISLRSPEQVAQLIRQIMPTARIDMDDLPGHVAAYVGEKAGK